MWPCAPRLCSARAAKVLGPRDFWLASARRRVRQVAFPWVGAGNRDVLPVLLPFSTFVTFLSFLFQSEGKIKTKKTPNNNEIKCNSCSIHTSGGSYAFAIFWVFVGRGIGGGGAE